MLKTNRGLLALVCCLLLVTAFSLPLAAQDSTPQTTPPPSDTYQDRSVSTPATPSNQLDNPSNTDQDREKPSDPSVQPQDRSTSEQPATMQNKSSANSDEKRLPGTASGMPLVGLIGAASLVGSAIRRRYF